MSYTSKSSDGLVEEERADVQIVKMMPILVTIFWNSINRSKFASLPAYVQARKS